MTHLFTNWIRVAAPLGESPRMDVTSDRASLASETRCHLSENAVCRIATLDDARKLSAAGWALAMSGKAGLAGTGMANPISGQRMARATLGRADGAEAAIVGRGICKPACSARIRSSALIVPPRIASDLLCGLSPTMPEEAGAKVSWRLQLLVSIPVAASASGVARADACAVTGMASPSTARVPGRAIRFHCGDRKTAIDMGPPWTKRQ